MMKKVLAVFLGIVMIFSLTACGSKTESKWAYSEGDFASFSEAFSDKALNQEDSDIDIVYVHDIELDDNISKDDVLLFNYDKIEDDEDYEYISYDLIKKYQINIEKIDITSEPSILRVYFNGSDDLFVNYGVLINKDVTKGGKYIITKTQEEYLGSDEENYNGLENLTFAPLFTYLNEHGITMEQLIEDGVLTELNAKQLANNDNPRLSVIGNLCSYLGCNVADIMEFVPSGVHEVAHEIDWDTETEAKQDYESTGIISFKPLLAYLKEHDITMYRMIKDEVVTATESTRIRSDHNFRVRFVMRLCMYLQTDVSDVIEFVED